VGILSQMFSLEGSHLESPHHLGALFVCLFVWYARGVGGWGRTVQWHRRWTWGRGAFWASEIRKQSCTVLLLLYDMHFTSREW